MECIVRMDPQTQTTTLHAPNTSSSYLDATSKVGRKEDKQFTFDKSFWSHSPNDAHYATQEDIYSSFGEEFLDHNFDGYHTCIFAYGQTGSGKSYTMMGTKEQPGLIPRTCEALFTRIRDSPEPHTTYTVHVSYFEVYNEHVRDLLVNTEKGEKPYYLKIRESQTDGVYVQGLTDAPVQNYNDVKTLMAIGDSNRTTASTKMNDTSSRSHAVFTIQLRQIRHELTTDETIERTARMRLVDLAGSERADRTEATGQRLVEGGKINKSLTTLGRVIAALADPRRQPANGGGSGRNSPRPGTPSQRRPQKAPLEVVPYRDSVLTWLLKDSLGGNSKTAMVACISPTDYAETLSTLRYADQAKRIRTRAHANIDAISSAQRDAQIKDMAAMIESLKRSVQEGLRRKKEESEGLEAYQQQVSNMQRLMDEQRRVSEARIAALVAEVEEINEANAKLQSEADALRRHLGLVVGELRDPIVLPDSFAVLDENAKEQVEEEQKATDTYEAQLQEEKENFARLEREMEEEMRKKANDPNSSESIMREAEEMLTSLSMFRKMVNHDRARFLLGPLSEVDVNRTRTRF